MDTNKEVTAVGGTMGLFAKLKEVFSAQKYIFKAMSEMDQKNAAYAAMTQTELEQLSDDELISAALYRIDKKLDLLLGKKKKGTPADWSKQLTNAPKNVYILSYFESDVQTGGLEYFLVRNPNLSKSVSDCFHAIGAYEHQQLCDAFFTIYGYKLNYAERMEHQDKLKEFDRSYQLLPPLEPIFAAYLRANLNDF